MIAEQLIVPHLRNCLTNSPTLKLLRICELCLNFAPTKLVALDAVRMLFHICTFITKDQISNAANFNKMDNSFKSSFHPSLLDIDHYPFMSTPPTIAVCDGVAQFVRRVLLREKLTCCIVCSREVQGSLTETVALNEIPNVAFLRPREVHIDHDLTHGALIHFPAVVNDGHGAFGSICRQCMRRLNSFAVPSISIAAGHWVGDLVAPLMDLTLAEKLLVARQPAAAYIIQNPTIRFKMEMAIGLDHDACTSLLSAVLETMPMAVVSMKRFFKFQSSGDGFTTLPDCLRVNRFKVDAALQWLKLNNPHYSDIIISRRRLAMLPISGVPAELAIHLKKVNADSLQIYSDVHQFG